MCGLRVLQQLEDPFSSPSLPRSPSPAPHPLCPAQPPSLTLTLTPLPLPLFPCATGGGGQASGQQDSRTARLPRHEPEGAVLLKTGVQV